VLSADGALVPLVGGIWGEVKTMVIGQVERTTPVHSTRLSYFSRLLDAQTFSEQATVEVVRRGIAQSKQVWAVMDGAEWMEGFIDLHRADAVRILDFAHAAKSCQRDRTARSSRRQGSSSQLAAGPAS
jgi:hypothetical protein